MSLIALVSDIHGNIDALEAVFHDIDSREVDEIICLGDIVGYGAAPAECVALIRERCSATVIGNHDELVVRANDEVIIPERVAAGLRLARSQLSDDQLAWLRDLLRLQQLHEFTIVHASLDCPEQYPYISSDAEARVHFRRQETALCFIGHTHVPIIAEEAPEGIKWVIPGDKSILLNQDHRSAINVGSIGQPRDEDPRASYGLFDNDHNTFQICRIPYDIKKAQERMRTAGLPESNARRLELGK